MQNYRVLNRILLIFIFVFTSINSNAQNYAYRQYNTKDGLVGNKVYQILEDKNHYLWFATESGVSCFDGIQFKNYTTENGLPDNDVIKIFEDSRGRIWMMPFNNKICFYENGKIHNAANNKQLAKMKINAYVSDMAEDESGNLYFAENKNNLFVLMSNGEILSLKNDKVCFFSKIGKGGKNRMQIFSNTDTEYGGLYDLDIRDNKIRLSLADKNDSFLIDKINYFAISENIRIWNTFAPNHTKSKQFNIWRKGLKTAIMDIPSGFNNFSGFRDDYFFINTTSGSYKIDFHKLTCIDTFFQKQNISYSLNDSEGNMWFSTLGKGVFRIQNEGILNVFNDEVDDDFEFQCVGGSDGKNIFGSNKGDLCELDNSSGKYKFRFLTNTNSSKRVIKIKKHAGRMFISNENQIFEYRNKNINRVAIVNENNYSIKDFDFDSDGKLYIANNIALFNEKNLVKGGYPHYLFPDGCTNVVVADSCIYVGNNSGVYSCRKNYTSTFLGDRISFFKEKNTCLGLSEGYLWAGTSNVGIICYNGRNNCFKFDVNNGLSSNNILSIYSDSNYFWVGTDKGLNKIDISGKPFKVVKRYTVEDGISGNTIKNIYSYKDKVYVVTENGISFIDENKVNTNSMCTMAWPDVKVNGKKPEKFNGIITINQNDNLELNFHPVSYRSEGEFVLMYRLSGLDNKWRSSNINNINYSYLPYGNFELLVYSVNRFGVKSDLIRIDLQVNKKYYQKTWFILLSALLIFMIPFPIFYIKQKRTRKINEEKAKVESRISSLKQDAYKSQMNPHFIFNALNSIQHYVIDKDIEKANAFISGFAVLIRTVLDNSGKKQISLSEEIAFLENYLKLEQLRFENSFQFKITVLENIDAEEVQIPPMMIQPFVENAVIHGLRHRKKEGGLVTVEFGLLDEGIICIITDNGAGRKKSESFNMLHSRSHESSGIKNVIERMTLLSMDKNDDYKIDILDLPEGNGTKVTLKFPGKYDTSIA